MNPNFLLFTFILPILVSGCSADEDALDPDEGLMGIGFEVHYLGGQRGDDNDLYARFTFPTEEENAWHRLSSEEDDGQGSAGYDCLARRPAWEGKWWIEVALYEEINGEFINRQRWDIDCYRYWIVIDESGQMELHKGDPPWDRPRGIPDLSASVVIAALALGLLAWHRR